MRSYRGGSCTRRILASHPRMAVVSLALAMPQSALAATSTSPPVSTPMSRQASPDASVAPETAPIPDVATQEREPAVAMSLPGLTHRRVDISLEYAAARLTPIGSTVPFTAHLFHLEAELPWGKSFYVGAAYNGAVAQSATEASSRFVSGQPELTGRLVHESPSKRFAVGAGGAVIVPAVSYDKPSAHDAIAPATIAGALRPWDFSSFVDRRITFRPSVDVRSTRPGLIAQFRQSLDVSFRTDREPDPAYAQDALQIVSISSFYLGWQPMRQLSVGAELWEVYLLRTDLPIRGDSDRTAFAFSPQVRVLSGSIETALSVLVPVGPTLVGSVEGYRALRLGVMVHID